MLRKFFRKEKVPEDLLDYAKELTQPPRKDLKKIIRQLLRTDPENYDDMYVIFLKARAEGLYREKGREVETICRLQCLTDIDQRSAEQFLLKANPPGSILHAVERLLQEDGLSKSDRNQAILQYVLCCYKGRAIQHSQGQKSIIGVIDAARRPDVSRTKLPK